MKTQDEILKIKATLLYILEGFPDGVDFIKLFKILYFAQQDHLVKYGRPIVNESFHALKHGPVPSFTYKAFQAGSSQQVNTRDFIDFLACFSFKSINGIICVIGESEPDKDELSISDIKCLDHSILQNKDIKSYDLSVLSHDKAWKFAYSRAKNDPEKDKMTLIDIAKAGNASNAIIKHIRECQSITKALRS